MTYRELFDEIMHYGTFDRMPVLHWAIWGETRERWISEGMPKDADEHKFLNASGLWNSPGYNLAIYPQFPEETLEENDKYRIYRSGDGVLQQEWKHMSCIPRYMDWTLKTARDWPEFKKRLQPHPNRIPPDLDKHLRDIEAGTCPISVYTGSMMGWIRDWMGVEHMSYLMYDDPDCYGDMVDTIADLVCWTLDQILPKMRLKPAMGLGWEDICGSSGPLVSPHIFDKWVAPGYRKIRNKLDEFGVRIYGIDSDGYVEPLIQNWLDAGVNLQFPLQPGRWGTTPESARKKFGKELRIFGAFDKMVLEKDHAAIDAEIARHVPMLKQGGFLLMPDHFITPGVPLANYQYYLDCIRRLRF